MWCMVCNSELIDCTCPDLMERLTRATKGGAFVFERCKVCGQHHSKCQCENPEPEIVGERKPSDLQQ